MSQKQNPSKMTDEDFDDIITNISNSSENGTLKKKKILAIFAVLFFIAFMVITTFVIGYPFIKFIEKPEQFRSWLSIFGILGDLVYILIVALQVIIAIIPGEPFEFFAGIAFGVFKGTLLCLVGATIGTAAVFLLVRKFGIAICNLFFSVEKLKNLKFLKNTKKNKNLLFIIFLLPGTPKDLITFFIGLTDIKISEWLIISTIARIPSVITSVICGNNIENGDYKTAIIVFAVTALISIGGMSIYHLILKFKNKK
jgi:uncharacterized membrane protein YdjX (TVP38/TMEM64 family)